MEHVTHNIKHKTFSSALFIIIVFFLFFVLCSMFYIPSATAQFDLPTTQFQLPNLNLATTLSLSTDPTTPLPNSFITITASVSGITNVSNSTYTWFINGIRQITSSGLNKNIFSFPTGPLGTIYKVSVTVITPSGENFSDAVSLTVSDFDLTWDTNTQAPAEYRGKLLPTQNSIIDLVALPMIYRPGAKNLISSGNLIYNWFINDKFNSEKSGINKPNIKFRINNFAGSSISIHLQIGTEDKIVSIEKSITIPVVAPQTLIYLANSATNRAYGNAIRSLVLGPQAVSVNFIAQNYFFNTTASQLKWQWLVDNEKIPAKSDQPWLAGLNIPKNIIRPFFMQIQALVKNSQNELETGQSTINLEVK